MAQLIGTQWLFVHDDNAASIMGLVQAVSTLPLLLLVLPAGVLADAFDRRILLVGVNAYLAATSTLLAAATFLGLVPPVMLLGFVFLINAGSALQAAAWQPLVAELVPRNGLAAATRLDMVSGNLGRMVGPLVAGALIAWVDVALVFAMNALCSLAFLVLLLLWDGPAWRRFDASGSYRRSVPVAASSDTRPVSLRCSSGCCSTRCPALPSGWPFP
ncbi:MFS transporter [Tessaracoccus sp. HDW20]|nr:MFS transporter [Tessaracoccus coleopterorum]